jgi:hypothetical protein
MDAVSNRYDRGVPGVVVVIEPWHKGDDVRLTKPLVRVSIDDGIPQRVFWGSTLLPVAPGPHLVSFAPCGWLKLDRRLRALVDVEVPLDGAVTARYRFPFAFGPPDVSVDAGLAE